MAAQLRATERTYDLEDGAEVPWTSGWAGVDGLVGPEELVLATVYFDTADLRLAAAGVTLRHLQGGDPDGWHLRFPVDGDHRDQVRVRDDRQDRRRRLRPPAELVAQTRAFTRDAVLTQVATIATTRRWWRLVDQTGTTTAVLVDDHVVAHRTGADTTATSWRELGVEVGTSGDPDLLDGLDRQLSDAGIHRAAAATKLARVLGERVDRAPEPRRFTRRSMVADVVLDYVADQAAALRHADPLVRRNEPDAVHHMRVVTRRLRSALQAYDRVVDRDHTRDLTDELRWLAGVLGVARDLEVLRERCEHAVAELPDELVLGPVVAGIPRSFAGREASARAAVLAALDGDRYLALLVAVDRLLADPPLTRYAARPVGRVVPTVVKRHRRRIERHLRRAAGHEAGPERDVELHDARKAAKKLRYAVEAVAPVLGGPARRIGKRAKALQQLLGEHHDAVTARPVLRELAVRAHLDGGNGFTYGVLYERESDRARHCEAGVHSSSRRLRRTTRKLS